MSTTMPRASRSRGPSIQDVARLAGVSAQTVSRVSTGSETVREETRTRVLRAMDQLGYSPNHAARALRSGSFGTIGMLSQHFERTGEALITGAVMDAAAAKDYSVTMLRVQETEGTNWDTAAQRISHQAIDGLVIIRTENSSPETLSLPAGIGVAVSDSRFIGHYPSVVSDQVQGAEDAVVHLLDLGHATVHHLAGPPDSPAALTRAATWRRTLEQRGIRPPQAWLGDWSAASGYALGKAFADDPAVTAVFAANDEMAFGLLRALHECGRRVPDDISVVGFDSIALSEFAAPPLTTIRQDFQLIGEELVRLVLAPLQKVTPEDRILIPTELVVRGSTAPPPR